MKKIILLASILLLTTNAYSQWTQVGGDIDGEGFNDTSGSALSLSSDGSIIAIGSLSNNDNGSSSGQVRVYQNLNGVWTQIGSDLNGVEVADHFGNSVCLSSDGSILAVAARGAGANGQIKVYNNNNGSWTQVGSTISGGTIDDFGEVIDMSADGTIVAVGAPANYNNVNNPGCVKVYKYENGVWNQLNGNIVGESGNDLFGTSVALSADGSIVAIGAIANDGVNGLNSGHVRVFKNENNTWNQIGSDLDGEASGDLFGTSVALSANGNVLAVGAERNGDGGIFAGHVRVFRNENGNWNQIGSDIDGAIAVDNFGKSVSLSSDGNILAAGAPNNPAGGNSVGNVRVFKNENDTWIQINSDINGESNFDYSGTKLDLSSSGNIIAIGAPLNDGPIFNYDVGHVRVYENPTLSLETFKESNFIVYPNPVNSYLYIDNKQKFDDIILYDSQGRTLKTIKSDENRIDFNNLSSGIYYIDIKYGEINQIKKIIKY